jgi:hypothetical protein
MVTYNCVAFVYPLYRHKPHVTYVPCDGDPALVTAVYSVLAYVLR